MTTRVMIVGDPGEMHVGAHFLAGAAELGLAVMLVDHRRAFGGRSLRQRALWRTVHRPVRLRAFSRELERRVADFAPDVVVTTGLAPVTADTLERLGQRGVRCLNYLTDDPWNRAHRSRWFLDALPHYDGVFTPRRSIVNDLTGAAVRRVEATWFAYNPLVHFPEEPDAAEAASYDCDVLVVGGADRDRVELVGPLLATGARVHLHGGYWDRYATTAPAARGMLDAAGVRHATARARVCVGFVRRANRDDHVMRSFEIPAMRGCLLAERTEAHLELFGPSDTSARFFDSAESLAREATALLDDVEAQHRLRQSAHELVVSGRHTYADRLSAMLQAATV